MFERLAVLKLSMQVQALLEWLELLLRRPLTPALSPRERERILIYLNRAPPLRLRIPHSPFPILHLHHTPTPPLRLLPSAFRLPHWLTPAPPSKSITVT
jgi:hypothetical protein